MDDNVIEEDTKEHFDAIHNAHDDDDAQPDPDESLMMDAGNGRVWLVKIPKFLMERWSAIDAEGIHLATIRVYHGSKSASGKGPRIVLTLPPNPENPSEEGDQYEMDMVNDTVQNQVVVAEREKEPSTGSRARTTILTGQVKHECNLRPVFTERYRQRLKERAREAATPKRMTMRMEEADLSGQGRINMLTRGVLHTSPFNVSKPKAKPQKGQFERMARIPRDKLLDELFAAFSQKDHWSIKSLRERTQQPEVYLKETLSDIATLHRSGEHNGTWELMPNYKREGVKAEDVIPGPNRAPIDVDAEVLKLEGEEDDDDDDDDDEDDMEEVS